MNKLFLILLFLSGSLVLAQNKMIKGFVLDGSNGSPVPGASVWIEGTQKGVASDENGYFQLSGLAPGKLTLHIRSVGFEEQSLNTEIRADKPTQVLIQLKPQTIELGNITITGARKVWENTNTVSMHTLTSATIKRIPGMTGTPDLGEYLQLLPGIIFTGDQGGQFFIRGGAPVHNLVKLDGMTVINPFHSIGFISVFDTETIAGVDVYTAGFSAEYGGRLSSVIDVRTRPGNRTRTAGVVNLSNFGYGVTLDVPIVKMTKENPRSVSVLLSNKSSYIDLIDNKLYPYLDETGIPYRYNDLFGKVSLMGIRGDQLDIQGTRITDHAWMGEGIQSSWINTAGGVRFITSPNSSSWLYQASTFYSDYHGQFLEVGESPRETYFSSYENRMKIFRMGEICDWEIGLSLDMYNSNHSFKDIVGAVVEREYFTTELVSYVANKTRVGKWLFEAGIHLVYYADQTFFSPEPRLKIKYSLSPAIQLNFASGWYSQNLMSATSDRDIMALFQGFYMGPDLVQDYFHGEFIIDKIQQAWHAVGGFSLFTKNNIKLTVEGYYKDFVKLVSYNRNRMFRDSEFTWNIPEYLKSFFLLETGTAYGLDFLCDYQKNNFSFWMGYSLAWVFREDEQMAYVPHYDRRHNINLLTGYQFGKKKKWDLKARWNLGSGFPFTQTNGVYEDIDLEFASFALDFTANSDMQAWYADLNQSRLPWYHRLDISLNREFEFSQNQKLELTLGIINVYNRKNMFYINRLNYKRVDQYPIMPNLTVKYRF